jgi:hypothetical protein
LESGEKAQYQRNTCERKFTFCHSHSSALTEDQKSIFSKKKREVKALRKSTSEKIEIEESKISQEEMDKLSSTA